MRNYNILEISATGKVPRQLFALLFMLAALKQISVDLYLPSLPAISRAFMASSAAVQMTVAAYLFGLGAAQLIYGPWSDAVGRRRPLLMGAILAILGSILCCFAPDITTLILGRFLQGIGAGACSVVGRSAIRDLVSGQYLSRLGGQMGMASSVMLVAAPAIGGYIEAYASWRVAFWVLLIYGIFLLIFLWAVLPETHQKPDSEAVRVKKIVHNYRQLLVSPVFMGYTLCGAFAYSGLLAYLTAAPFLLQTTLHLRPIEFGWLALFTASGIFTSSLINFSCVLRYGVIKMLLAGIVLMMIGGGSMLIAGCLGFLNIAAIVLPMVIFCMGAGLTFQNANVGAFELFSSIAGSASAIYGTLQILSGAIVSTLMAILPERTQMPLAWTQVTLVLLAMVAWTIARRAHNENL
jgi:DHA1 family 2-module integral membrane pump EmrD-like MFS transporter